MDGIIAQLNNYEWMPYSLPVSSKKRAGYLAKVLNLPDWCKSPGTEDDVRAMAATILYPRLDRFGKTQVLTLLRDHSNQSLADCLRGEIATTTLVQKKWGLWSLSSPELEAMHKEHKFISNLLTTVGAKSVLDLLKDFKSIRNTKHYVVLLSILYAGNKVIEKSVDDEIKRRTEVEDYVIE